MMPSAPIVVAQITDTHLFAEEGETMKGVATARSLQSVLERVDRLSARPDLLLLTGDLSQDETAESYQRLVAAVSSLGIPTYWIRGNHDQQPELLTAWLDRSPFSAQKAIQTGGWNMLLLDSAVAGEVSGRLTSKALLWLDQQLRDCSLPTLVSLHHPPLRVGSSWMDKIGLQNGDEFLAVIDRHPQIKLVLFGHIHQAFNQTRNGVRYLGTPSSCVQFKPYSETFGIDDRPPGFRLLTLFADGQYETTVERIQG